MADTPADRVPLLQRLLDHGRTWGSLEVSGGRYGMTRFRLVVFPPGLTRDERVWLRLWRWYPGWGVATWLILEVTLLTVMSPGAAFAISAGTSLAAGATTMVLSANTRCGVRTMTVTKMTGVNDAECRCALDDLKTLAERLVEADARRDAGRLSTVEHEARVWQVYDQMAA